MNNCPRTRSAAPQCGSGDVKARGLVAGVGAGCFPQLYEALAPAEGGVSKGAGSRTPRAGREGILRYAAPPLLRMREV